MKLFFLGQLAVTYAGLADFFDDVSYQAEDAWLAEVAKSSEERWHKNQCQEYLLPDVPGGYWECKGNKKCALKCHNEGGVHASVKCKGGTWKGAKGAKCPTKKDDCKCHDKDKPVVKHGWWDCWLNDKGIYQCDLICDDEKNGGSPPKTPGGKPVSIFCKNDKWWCNDVDPHCPAPGQHCPKNKLRKVEGAEWKCDKKGDHCDLHCPGGDIAACAASCNRKTCQWEYAGKLECKDPCTKKKKKMCEESCGKHYPQCCKVKKSCICDKYPDNDECISKCEDCPKPMTDGSGRWDCKVVTMKGETKCDKKGKKCTTTKDEKRYVCQFHCQNKFTGKMIVCKDEKWWGNVPSDKFTCNPKCGGKLYDVANGSWECKDRYDSYTKETIQDADCVLKCDPGYEPQKNPTEATCQPNGEYNHNCQAKCVKSCEAKGMAPCANGKGCCPRPCGPPCDKQKKPKVAGAWWECMIDEHCKETCLLKCLNGIIPTNKHGYHVSIKCDKARWWANDPCIADLCKPPPVIKTCNWNELPSIPYSSWECTPQKFGANGGANAGVTCVLDCADGKKVHHAYECSPDGDWFKKYGHDKCECDKPCDRNVTCCPGAPHFDSDQKGHANYNKHCDDCVDYCPKKNCDESKLPKIHGNGKWHCATIKGKGGHPEYACVVMCNGNKTKQVMVCKMNKNGDCQWRGNINGHCKCEDECDASDLTKVYDGNWKCKDEGGMKICALVCNGAVKTTCEAKCNKNGKQNWQYDTKITKDHCSGVHKPKDDPCLDGCLKCNDYNTPHIPNGKWDCKKKHCDLVCNKGYKTKNGKCSLKCENHKWKTIGDPHCVPILPGPTKKPKPTKNPTKPTKKPTKPPKPTTTVKPTTKAPKKCPKFVPVKNGWMECKPKKQGVAFCMLMCNRGYYPEYCDSDKDAMADYNCETGYFSPSGPKGKKSSWGCVKGACNHKQFGQICYDHKLNAGQEKPSFG